MYLLDTNIILEILLDQKNAEKCANFINAHLNQVLFITDFSYFSISVKMFNLKRFKDLQKLHEDLIISRIITIIKLESIDWDRVIHISKEFNLDFDDSYQFAAATKFSLQIVSYDKDFDLTSLNRFKP